MFEVVYTFLWYIGPINHVPALDYMGVTPEAVASGVSLCYLLASGVLLSLAVLGRWREMR
jgi:glucose uptake protein GlcU